MNKQTNNTNPNVTSTSHRQPALKILLGTGAAALTVLVLAAAIATHTRSVAADVKAAELPSVAVSAPLTRQLDTQLGFLGQYSAVDKVELRAQVGGTLTSIHFKDGDIVHKGDLLFTIDSEPYEIKFSQAQAALESAKAHLDLATRALTRAETLKARDAGSTENVEQRTADKLAAIAAVDSARALVRDARFDLDHSRITAPFTGRIGNHQVSVGNLVSGSRGGTSPTTLLTTLVSLDPIYLDFDMSEADYTQYQSTHERERSEDNVAIAAGSSGDFSRLGKLDFIDNSLDRSSGTIHARAIVPNGNMELTPGGFGRLRLSMTKPTPTMLVPDASVLPDQSQHIVLTVAQDGTVGAKHVELGALRGGLRVIRSGLEATDRVVVDGIPVARPGSKVAPHEVAIEFAGEKKADEQRLSMK